MWHAPSHRTVPLVLLSPAKGAAWLRWIGGAWAHGTWSHPWRVGSNIRANSMVLEIHTNIQSAVRLYVWRFDASMLGLEAIYGLALCPVRVCEIRFLPSRHDA